MKEKILLKVKESLTSIIPISLIIAILSFTITPGSLTLVKQKIVVSIQNA